MNIQDIKVWLGSQPYLLQWINLVLLALACMIVYFIVKNYLLRAIATLFRKSRTHFDDIIVEKRVLVRLAYIIPVIMVYHFSPYIPGPTDIIRQIMSATLILLLVLVIGSFLSAVNEIYSHLEFSRKFPLKSYLQVLKIIIYVLGGLTIISVLAGKSPWVLLSGVGAMTAVLMLIFRDTILSFVASIQISSSDLLKVGDWIEAPDFGADGDVIDIALHHIKIQNWDKTISTIPTYKLIDSSFKNWRGMTLSGGRRVKRSIYIDMNSINFCTDEMLDKYRKIDLIRNYIDVRLREVEDYNKNHIVSTESPVNGRRLTNIGTFRAYIVEYLKQHPKVHQSMTLLVRQLKPGEYGLPIELYFFTNDTDWINYEGIQSDIFDHVLAVIPEFDLKVFQNPTGSDFSRLSRINIKE